MSTSSPAASDPRSSASKLGALRTFRWYAPSTFAGRASAIEPDTMVQKPETSRAISLAFISDRSGADRRR
jgi:hypothetical protein